MIYNTKAPLHYNQYWTLQDEDKDLEDMASSILLGYIQAWGQENKERLQTLTDVSNSIGFHIEVLDHINISTGKKEFVLKVPDKEEERFVEYREKIRTISRGNFESEVVQIANILTEYRIKKRWYQFWK